MKSNIFKISDGTIGRKKVCHKKSAEVIVGMNTHTEGPNVYMVQPTIRNARTVRNQGPFYN